jgi:hypothetical protein
MQTIKFSVFRTDSRENLENEKNLIFKGSFQAFSPKEAAEKCLFEFKVSENCFLMVFWNIGDIHLNKKFCIYSVVSVSYSIKEIEMPKQTSMEKKESDKMANELYEYYVHELGLSHEDAINAIRQTVCKDFSIK